MYFAESDPRLPNSEARTLVESAATMFTNLDTVDQCVLWGTIIALGGTTAEKFVPGLAELDKKERDNFNESLRPLLK